MTEKKSFIDNMENRLNQWKERYDEKIEELKEKGADYSEKWESELKNHAEKYENLRYQLTLLGNETGDKWDEMKDEIEKGYREMQRNFSGSAQEVRFSHWKNKMDEFLDDVAEKGTKYADEHKEEINELKDQYEKTRYQIKLLKNASADAWDDISEGAEQALNELKKSVTESLKHFKKD